MSPARRYVRQGGRLRLGMVAGFTSEWVAGFVGIRSRGRVKAVDPLQELHKLPAAVAIDDHSMDIPSQQVDAGQKAQGTVANVLVIPTDGGMDSGTRRQIGCCVLQGLDSRFLIVGQ